MMVWSCRAQDQGVWLLHADPNLAVCSITALDIEWTRKVNSSKSKRWNVGRGGAGRVR